MATEEEQIRRQGQLMQNQQASRMQTQRPRRMQGQLMGQGGGWKEFARKNEREIAKRKKAAMIASRKGKFDQLVNKKKPKKEVKDSLKALGTFVTEIKPLDDAMYFLIIMISIIADVFTLIPIVGNALAIFFSAIIWMLYVLQGNFFKGRTSRLGLKIGSNAGANVFEIFLPGLNMLPVFTGAALFNYVLVLIERKEQKIEQKKGGKSNLS